MIEPFSAAPEGPPNGCTPGRIGNVFFSRADMLKELSEKPPLWGRTTEYGGSI